MKGTRLKKVRGDRVQEPEAPEKRVERLYDSEGGPLVGWLLDETRQRGMQLRETAALLGVTPGYISQLRSGTRQSACIGQEFAQACARFLGVPTIVIKLIAGRISLADFAWPGEGEQGMVDRAFRRLKADPIARQHLPANETSLDYEAKRALVLLYGEASGADVLRLQELTWVLQYLQRPALVHNNNEIDAVSRQEDFTPLSAYEEEQCLLT